MRAVLYLRVSTKEQGTSRNGLQAQEAQLQAFCEANAIEVMSTYTEVASGGLPVAFRPILSTAFADAGKAGALVLVAKLDRLSRRAVDVMSLMERRVRFATAEDGLDVDPMMLHIKAVFAEKERTVIGQRTSAALQAKAARGEPLGVHTHRDRAATAAKANARAGEASRLAADAWASTVAPVLRALVAGRTYSEAAAALNAANLPTARGGRWHASTVCNAMKRLRE